MIVRLGKTQRPSGTWMSPRATIVAGFSRSMAWPAKRMEPRVARSTPEIVRLSVDFPAPFEPSTVTISPAASPLTASSASDMRASRAGQTRGCAMAEISLDDGRVAHHGLRRAFGDDAALRQHENLFGKPHHCLHHVLDHQYRYAPPGERADDRHHGGDL